MKNKVKAPFELKPGLELWRVDPHEKRVEKRVIKTVSEHFVSFTKDYGYRKRWGRYWVQDRFFITKEEALDAEVDRLMASSEFHRKKQIEANAEIFKVSKYKVSGE